MKKKVGLAAPPHQRWVTAKRGTWGWQPHVGLAAPGAGSINWLALPVLLQVDIVEAGLVRGELHQHRLVAVDASLRAQVRHPIRLAGPL